MKATQPAKPWQWVDRSKNNSVKAAVCLKFSWNCCVAYRNLVSVRLVLHKGQNNKTLVIKFREKFKRLTITSSLGHHTILKWPFSHKIINSGERSQECSQMLTRKRTTVRRWQTISRRQLTSYLRHLWIIFKWKLLDWGMTWRQKVAKLFWEILV